MEKHEILDHLKKGETEQAILLFYQALHKKQSLCDQYPSLEYNLVAIHHYHSYGKNDNLKGIISSERFQLIAQQVLWLIELHQDFTLIGFFYESDSLEQQNTPKKDLIGDIQKLHLPLFEETKRNYTEFAQNSKLPYKAHKPLRPITNRNKDAMPIQTASLSELETSEHDLLKEIANTDKETASRYLQLAQVNVLKNDRVKADTYFKKALELDGKNAELNNIYGLNLLYMGQYQTAKAHFKIAESELSNPVSAEDTIRYASYLLNIAHADLYLAEYLDAEGLCVESLRILKNEKLTEAYAYRGVAYNILGQSSFTKQEFDQAIAHYRLALEQISITFDVAEQYKTMNNLGQAYLAKDDVDNALIFFEKALETYEKSLDTGYGFESILFNNMGAAHLKKEAFDTAISYYKRALQVSKKAFGTETHHQIAVRYNNIGVALGKKKNYKDAIVNIQKAMAIDLNALGNSEHPQIGYYLFSLGRIHEEMGDLQKASSYFEKTLKILDKHEELQSHPIYAYLNK